MKNLKSLLRVLTIVVCTYGSLPAFALLLPTYAMAKCEAEYKIYYDNAYSGITTLPNGQPVPSYQDELKNIEQYELDEISKIPQDQLQARYSSDLEDAASSEQYNAVHPADQYMGSIRRSGAIKERLEACYIADRMHSSSKELTASTSASNQSSSQSTQSAASSQSATQPSTSHREQDEEANRCVDYRDGRIVNDCNFKVTTFYCMVHPSDDTPNFTPNCDEASQPGGYLFSANLEPNRTTEPRSGEKMVMFSCRFPLHPQVIPQNITNNGAQGTCD